MRTFASPIEVAEQMGNVIPEISRQLKLKGGLPLVVGICGGTSTGKSTVVSDLLRQKFKGRNTLIAQDHFQYLLHKRDQLDPVYGLDHIHHYGIRECVDILSTLRSGNATDMPKYDFKLREHVGTQLLIPNELILIDGLYAAYGPLATELDFVIYTESFAWERLIRRIIRNIYERYTGLAQDGNRALLSFMTRVHQAHVDFVLTQRERADVVIENPIRFGWLVEKHKIPVVERHCSDADYASGMLWSRSFVDCQCEIQIWRAREDPKSFVFRFTWGDLPYYETKVESHTWERIKTFNWLEN